MLDGTASSWPGVTQSIVDLKDIVGTLHRCERDNRAEAETMRKESQDLAVKLATAQNRLAGATQDAKEKEEYFQGLQGKLEGDLSQKATAFSDLQARSRRSGRPSSGSRSGSPSSGTRSSS